MKIDEGDGKLFQEDRQITLGDLDIVIDRDGFALKGYLRLSNTPDDRETAQELAGLLARVAVELKNIPSPTGDVPSDQPPPSAGFTGSAFDS